MGDKVLNDFIAYADFGKNISSYDDDLEVDEHIVAAAVYHGVIFSLPAPARHHTILNQISIALGRDAMEIPPCNQGFVTNTGRFVNRAEAYDVAYRAGQVTGEEGRGPQLYSEDVW